MKTYKISDITVEEVIEEFNRQNKIKDMVENEETHPLLKYRKIYELYNDDILDASKDNNMHGCDPYFIDWAPIFTPIEYSAWCSIRGKGVPFYPQYPVLNYILDFGNPVVKVGIECDGKNWHDIEKDTVRDEKLSKEGWKIIRITGSELNREYIDPCELRERDYEIEQYKLDECEREWILNTGDGVIESIMRVYFLNDYKSVHIESINNHSLIN